MKEGSGEKFARWKKEKRGFSHSSIEYQRRGRRKVTLSEAFAVSLFINLSSVGIKNADKSSKFDIIHLPICIND
jgi:hypothetical protein